MRIHNDDVKEAEKKKELIKNNIKRLPSCCCAHSAGYRTGYRQGNISDFATLVNWPPTMNSLPPFQVLLI